MQSAECDPWTILGRWGLQGRAYHRRKRELDQRFGPGQWRIRWLVNGRILDVPEAAREIEQSYLALFRASPDVLHAICTEAADVYENAASNVRSGSDYARQERSMQHVFDIAARRALSQLGRSFEGTRLWRLKGSPLDPGHVSFHRPEWVAQPPILGWWEPESILCFWNSNRVLEVRRQKP